MRMNKFGQHRFTPEEAKEAVKERVKQGKTRTGPSRTTVLTEKARKALDGDENRTYIPKWMIDDQD